MDVNNQISQTLLDSYCYLCNAAVSVFTTSGYANSSSTIVALSVRLADIIERKMKERKSAHMVGKCS